MGRRKKKKEYIEVFIKDPGCDLLRRERIRNDLKSLQGIVDGYIETVTPAEDLVCICNEEGLLRGLPYNISWLNIDFVGTVIFAGVNGDEFDDLPECILNNPERWFGLKCM